MSKIMIETDSGCFSTNVTIVSIVGICLLFAQVGTAATGTVNYAITYQQLEGFGGSGALDAWHLASHSKRETIYNYLFRDLGLDVYRIRNTYGYDSGNITYTGQFVAEAKERNPALKIELSAWSPPKYLKSNNDLIGGTLKGGPDNYVYVNYADWWADSMTAWANVGVYPDYISIQNEPEIETAWHSCRMDPTENSNYAGYDQAFEAVYNELYFRMGPYMPKMLAPETMGFGNAGAYIQALDDRGQIDNVYGFAHHLYTEGGYDNPDGMRIGMQVFADDYGYKPLFQTEYAADGTPIFDHAPLLAQHIYNSLVHEHVTSYYHWSLFRGSYTTGGMINLNSSSTYIIRDIYWFFKHYSYFTDPGWYLVDASTNSSNLRINAFKNPDNDELTIVITNISTSSVSLTLTLNAFFPDTSEVYRSSSTEHWSYIGTFDEPQPLLLPAESITTISLTGIFSPENCADVQAAGYGFASDISGDCYVNYIDLERISDFWLFQVCSFFDDCGGADFEPTDGVVDLLDFSIFAPQWLQCNDPEDSNCTPNW